MIALVLPAWRNFSRNLRRYRVLLATMILVSTVFTVLIGAMLGLQEAVRDKATRYFAGDVVVLGYDGSGDSLIEEVDAVTGAVERLREAGIGIQAVSRRSTLYRQESIELFFAGYSVRQRRLVGVEWEREGDILAGFPFTAGKVPAPGDRDAILISSVTASDLQVSVGDELLVSIPSARGRTNTAELIVRGIYTESSFFGFTAYLHREKLNALREVPAARVNEIGVYLETPAADEKRAAALLTEELRAAGLPTFPVLADRNEYETASRAPREQREYGVVTLQAQLAQITDLITALTIVSGAVVALFLGIVIIGVSNTWTMVVWERTREVGTLRALGLQRAGTVAVFLMEAAFLGLTTVFFGVFLGVLTLQGVHNWVPFAPNAATTLFFTEGHLPFDLPPWTFLLVAAIAVGASVFGALRAAVRAGMIHPVDALRHRL